MPASVANAAPTTVLPGSLSRAFVREQEYTIDQSFYPGDSTRQAYLLVTNSRKAWRLEKTLTPTQADLLLAFFEARKGPHEPFYFYDVFETSPQFSYDETGVATTGRYIVRFDGDVQYGVRVGGRVQLGFKLLELA